MSHGVESIGVIGSQSIIWHPCESYPLTTLCVPSWQGTAAIGHGDVAVGVGVVAVTVAVGVAVADRTHDKVAESQNFPSEGLQYCSEFHDMPVHLCNSFPTHRKNPALHIGAVGTGVGVGIGPGDTHPVQKDGIDSPHDA